MLYVKNTLQSIASMCITPPLVALLSITGNAEGEARLCSQHHSKRSITDPLENTQQKCVYEIKLYVASSLQQVLYIALMPIYAWC